jgi:hypothetical protein
MGRHDYEWQAERAARQTGTSPAAITEQCQNPGARNRVRLVWRWAQAPIFAATVTALFTVLFELQDHHRVALSVDQILPTTVVATIAAGIAAINKWRHRHDDLKRAQGGQPLVELFNELWRDGREFLELPPDSSEYAQWLTESRDEIGQYSPSLAADWSRGETTFAAGPPSREALERRVELVKALHRKVATEGVSLEELAAAGFPGAQEALTGEDPPGRRGLLTPRRTRRL